ncbi:unnamed protein product [Ilex paraguariensis]|uniref:3'-5' exonuclease n=1 Tax=Ilex paraguariensis TaxID=185542 RepID=A0ABC8RW09_9AQUA
MLDLHSAGVLPGKAAVMQICGENNHCYVMHIIHSGIPQNLQSLLEDPTSVKVGVSVANDANKVFHDHHVSIKALEDLSSLANQKLAGDPKKWSLGSLTEMLVCKENPVSICATGGPEGLCSAPLVPRQDGLSSTDATPTCDSESMG